MIWFDIKGDLQDNTKESGAQTKQTADSAF